MSSNTLLLNETFQVNSYTTIEGIFWGINLSLYFLYTQRFYSQYCSAPNDWNTLILPFIRDSIIVLAAGLELACGTKAMQLMYINHGGVHGEPEEFVGSTTFLSTIHLISFICTSVISILNPVVQLRCVWIMWGASSYKLALTIFLSFFVIVGQGIATFTYIMRLGTPEDVTILETVGFAVYLTFSLLVTLLLVGPIIVMRKHHNHVMGTTSENAMQYTSIIAMLIESYALNSVWSTAAMITLALSSAGSRVDASDLFNNPKDQVTVIALLLVRYRVLLGRDRTPERGTQVSSLRWNRNDPEATRATDRTTSLDHLPQVATGSQMVANENNLLVSSNRAEE